VDEDFEAVYRQHYALVVRYAARRLRHGEDPQDLAGEVFATAWRQRDRMPAQSLPWLYRIAANALLNTHRSTRRHLRLLSRAASEEPLREVSVQLEDDIDWVHTVLAQLKPADREVLRLHAWEELNLDDLAVALDCSRSAAAMRLHRARSRFDALVQRTPHLAATLRRSR